MISYLKGAAAALALFAGSAAFADDSGFEYWPGANYSENIPALETVLGYKSGDHITTHADTMRYFEALAAAAPDRIKLFDYGTTWEGRRLIYAAISSPENIAKLETFKSGMQALTDPRKTDTETAQRLIKDLPASTWLAYGVHGNEISSTDAAMMTAYHLLASTGDERVPQIMEDSIVFIAPMQNPDGRDRFIHRFRSAKGLVADSDPISAEHNEPWPSGRTNHYLFDMNRDWIVLTQPETQGHVKALQEWYPLVFVDLHEMGGNSSYYFAPEAVPFNPHLAQNQRDNLFMFGENNAKWFDKFGKRYFTRDVFDAFYPGYGASWPAYYGAIAMTYEQGSSRGLIYRRNDGSDLHYRDTVKGHFITSLATAEVTAKHREKILSDFYDYQVSAISEGQKDKDVRSYILPATRDKAANRKLVGLLSAQGVEVAQATADFKACGVGYSAGAYIVDTAQPRKRMVRTLLDPQVDMDPAWVAEQERLRAKNVNHDIYDVTAWSLPIMFNVEMNTCGKAVSTETASVSSDLVTPGVITGTTDNTVVYMVPWNDAAAARFLTAALRADLVIHANSKRFTKGGKAYPEGTLILNASENPAGLRATIAKLAAESGANVVASDSTWIESGADFGGRFVNRVHAPKVAIAWDEPTSQYSAGNTRFVIERQFNYPVTAIRTPDLARANLSRYQVIILPASWGSYSDALGESGSKNLSDWVKKGGVLIGTGTALRYLSDDTVGLLSVKREAEAKPDLPEQAKAEVENGKVPGSLITSKEELLALIEPKTEEPDDVPGVIVKAGVDKDHWLAAGLPSELNVLVRGRDIYTPIKLDAGTNVAWFKGADELLASGYVWDENRKQLAYKPFAIAERKGRGYVIGFTQDPTVRAYLDGLNLMLMNAIFQGSAQANPLR